MLASGGRLGPRPARARARPAGAGAPPRGPGPPPRGRRARLRAGRARLHAGRRARPPGRRAERDASTRRRAAAARARYSLNALISSLSPLVSLLGRGEARLFGGPRSERRMQDVLWLFFEGPGRLHAVFGLRGGGEGALHFVDRGDRRDHRAGDRERFAAAPQVAETIAGERERSQPTATFSSPPSKASEMKPSCAASEPSLISPGAAAAL